MANYITECYVKSISVSTSSGNLNVTFDPASGWFFSCGNEENNSSRSIILVKKDSNDIKCKKALIINSLTLDINSSLMYFLVNAKTNNLRVRLEVSTSKKTYGFLMFNKMELF